ncbi:uncharacterized protein LOC131428767 [Malaya genurostris]|uniref:uncharacterized protein LOC131428767 n=1 Tax=Malaya genurostris TaxID=325434 RepID=UPI0026F3BCB1|nr:uncharacterized protein LOC131428767 [Malaya genurostris]
MRAVQIAFFLSLNLIYFVHGFHSNESVSRHTEEGRALVFPSSSAMQFTIATSAGTPFFVPRKPYPFRRAGFNIGFQANYALPYRLQDFYKYPNWARAMVDVIKGRVMPTEIVTARAARKRRSSSRLSGGEIYRALDETLQYTGYGADCLIKSVCELAHSPFHDVENDLYAEILQFILTPSEHQSFEMHERAMKTRYETAERLGKEGADCDVLYPKCRKSFLSDFSDFVDEKKYNII